MKHAQCSKKLWNSVILKCSCAKSKAAVLYEIVTALSETYAVLDETLEWHNSSVAVPNQKAAVPSKACKTFQSK